MSRELFSTYARAAGLRTLRQRTFGWGDPAEKWGHIRDLDCFTLVEKPTGWRAWLVPITRRLAQLKLLRESRRSRS
jgi:hypothetical protein